MCEDSNESITLSVKSERGEMIWGNALLGGVIGGVVDANKDAHWELPDSVTLHRNNCGKDK